MYILHRYPGAAAARAAEVQAREASGSLVGHSPSMDDGGDPPPPADFRCVGCGAIPRRPLVWVCGHLSCDACDARHGSRACPQCHARLVYHPSVCLLASSVLASEAGDKAGNEAGGGEVSCGMASGGDVDSNLYGDTDGDAMCGRGGASAHDTASCNGGVGEADEGATSPGHIPQAMAAVSASTDDGADGAAAQAAVESFQYVHFGIGCDGCGSYPIRGRAYRCCECPEAIGYDLCELCYGSAGCRGRFGQAHRPEHRMEERAQEVTWLHHLQAANPQLGIRQILAMAQLAVAEEGAGEGEDDVPAPSDEGDGSAR